MFCISKKMVPSKPSVHHTSAQIITPLGKAVQLNFMNFDVSIQSPGNVLRKG